MKSPHGITLIEKLFCNMAIGDPLLEEYFFTYYSQKLILLNHFYPHVEGLLRGFTDHGPAHVTRVLKLYEKMLANNIPGMKASDVMSNAAMNFFELYLLLCATVWHDVGNLLGRDEHNEKIAEISDRLETNFFMDDDVRKYALQIAKAHTGADGVREGIPVVDANYKNSEVNVRFLGGLLRFADELEEGDVRVDSQFYQAMKKDKIDPKQKIYWETSLRIKRIEPKPDDSVIEIYVDIGKEEMFELFSKEGRDVALIDELISRIDKMNQERMYFMLFVRKHIEYRKIVLQITLANKKPRKVIHTFDDSQGYESFWQNFPDLDPRENVDGYKHLKGATD